MSRTLPGEENRRPRSSDLERLWQALLLTNWECLVVIPTDRSTPSDSVLAALRAVVAGANSPPLEVVDGRKCSMKDGDRLASTAAQTASSGRRVVAFIDAITESLAGVPMVRAADSALLVVQVDSPDAESLASTLSIVGVDRVVGSVTVPASD
jgi:hypothetical protein